MGRDHTRRLQIGFFIVLTFTAAQVLWWILDQSRYSREILEHTLFLYQADASAAFALLEAGRSPADVREFFPHLAVDVTGGGRYSVRVSDAARDELERDRRSHLNQYHWEGGFFLLVLLMAMVVLWRTLRQETALRRRQQDFLAAVSHEFKSPLASLQLAADTMARRSLDEEGRRRWMRRIRGDVRRLGVMIANILDTARLEKGEIEFAAEPVPLAPAVAKVVDEVSDRAAELGVSIAPLAAGGLRVQADPDAFHTVVRNLIENAVNAASAAGGGTVTLSAEVDGGKVRLVVSDDGIGFEPGEAAKLFQRFYRVGDELRRTSPGTGLGLAIVRRFVELEGGEVSARSDGPGQGARFTVAWPRAAGEAGR